MSLCHIQRVSSCNPASLSQLQPGTQQINKESPCLYKAFQNSRSYKRRRIQRLRAASEEGSGDPVSSSKGLTNILR